MNLRKFTDILKKKKKLIFLDQMIVSGSNFLLGIFLARKMSLVDFGNYSLMWLVVMFFLSIQQSGIIAPMYSLEPLKNNKSKNYLLDHIVIIQFYYAVIVLVLVIIFCFISSFFFDKWDFGYQLIPFCSVLFLCLIHDFTRRCFYLNEKYLKVIKMDLIAYFGLLSLCHIYTIYNTLDLSTFFTFMFFVFLISFLSVFSKKRYFKLKKENTKLTLKAYWDYSKWLSFSAIIGWFTGNIFVLVGSYLIGAWVAGVIRIFQNTMGIFNVLFLGLENFVPTTLAKIYKSNGFYAMEKYVKKIATSGVMIFIIFGSVFIFFKPKLIIEYVYGSEFSKYSNIIYAYILIYVFFFIGTLIRFIYRTLEKTNSVFNVYLISLFFTVTLSYPLVRFYGIYGIVLGTLIIQILMVLIYVYNLKQIIRNL
jgi:O-antigen/teichoic acid export membrane protein